MITKLLIRTSDLHNCQKESGYKMDECSICSGRNQHKAELIRGMQSMESRILQLGIRALNTDAETKMTRKSSLVLARQFPANLGTLNMLNRVCS